MNARTHDRLSLLPQHRQKIEEVLQSYAPGVGAREYGSRVSGRDHPGSDLDLVLRGPGLERPPLEVLGAVSEAFHDSTIPFFVGARDWARLPESSHAEIERDYVVQVAAGATPQGGSAASTSSGWRRRCEHRRSPLSSIRGPRRRGSCGCSRSCPGR